MKKKMNKIKFTSFFLDQVKAIINFIDTHIFGTEILNGYDFSHRETLNCRLQIKINLCGKKHRYKMRIEI